MRVLDTTFLTEDEEYLPERSIAGKIRTALEKLKMDTYNELYVIRVTVDKVDPTPEETDADT